jgi:hypothetical protein
VREKSTRQEAKEQTKRRKAYDAWQRTKKKVEGL